MSQKVRRPIEDSNKIQESKIEFGKPFTKQAKGTVPEMVFVPISYFNEPLLFLISQRQGRFVFKGIDEITKKRVLFFRFSRGRIYY